MYLLSGFICSFALAALPIILFRFISAFVDFGSASQTLLNIVIIWSAYLSWFISPIAGCKIARMVFFGKIKVKDRKMPPSAKNAAIATTILATFLGFLVFIALTIVRVH